MNEKEAGFTIMELMIAVAIFSVILLLCAQVLVGVGGLFSKGVSSANVQDDARNIINDVTASIQFSGSVMNNGQTTNVAFGNNVPYGAVEVTYNVPPSTQVETYAYCFGNVRYSFVLGFPGTGSWTRVLWKDQMLSSSTCAPLNIEAATPSCMGAVSVGPSTPACSASQPGTGQDLVGANTSLGNFQIYQYNPELYSVSLGLAYGQEGLFISNNGVPVVQNNQNYECSTSTGEQYCSTSYLSTLATERVATD